MANCDNQRHETDWDLSLRSLWPSETAFSSSKSCKGISYDPPPKQPPLSEEEKKSILSEQTIRIAKPALAHYNGRNRTKYELVDPVCSNGFLCNGIWFHCNFTARNGISPAGDSATKLFFAELKIVRLKSGTRKYLVTACRPIDGAKTVIGCDKCLEIIEHPPHGFRQGLHHYKPRNLRPRSNGTDQNFWSATSSGFFSIKSAIQLIRNDPIDEAEPFWKLPWKTWAPQRIRVFLWILHDKIMSNSNRARRGVTEDPCCGACNNIEETSRLQRG